MARKRSFLRFDRWIALWLPAFFLAVVLVEFGSRRPLDVLLAIAGGSLFIGIWFWHINRRSKVVLEELVPAFIPPPGMMMIPPVIKTVLKVSAPAKVKLGETCTVTAEIYSYELYPYLDVSDALFKHLFRNRPHVQFSLTLETPSFEYAPQGAVMKSEQDRFPLVWKWILEPKSLGAKLVHVHLGPETQQALNAFAPLQNPVELSIYVVSQFGLSKRATLWLQIVGAVIGVILTLQFLAPLFKKIGESLTKVLFHSGQLD